MQSLGELRVEAYRYGGCWAIMPRSHLPDRITLRHEFVYWPPGALHGGSLSFWKDDEEKRRAPVPAEHSRRLAFLRRPPSAPVDLDGRYALDLRAERYANWSHQMNRYLLIASELRRRARVPITIVLHAAMAGFVERLYRYFGFEVVRTDAPLISRSVGYELDRQNTMLALRPDLVRSFADFDFAPPSQGRVIERLFLARRGTRRLANEAELLPIIERFGYECVYAEDHSPADQIAMIRGAQAILNVHGAALAPLQFRPPGRDFSLIEILPAGHVTDFFRIMCDQVGGRYLAVRGRARRAYLPGIYAEQPFVDHSLDDFEVDPAALELALRVRHEGFDPIGNDALVGLR